MVVDACLKINLWIFFLAHVLTAGHAATTTSCPQQWVRCNITMVCIDSRYLCDGDDDCGNGEDELNCGARDSGCGGLANQTGMGGTISSMGYPGNYSNLADCKWYIQAPIGYVLLMEFAAGFELQKRHHGGCVYDAVSIYKENTLHLEGEFCGSLAPDSLVVNGNRAVVEFRSDFRWSGMGFKLSWTAQKVNLYLNQTKANTESQSTGSTSQPVCGDVLEVSDGLGYISSPLFNDKLPYPAPLLCRWRIKVRPAYFISIHFDFLDIDVYSSGTCQDGWLEVFDGHDENAASIGKFCGRVIPAELRSTSNEVFVVMTASSNTDKHTGFTFLYTAFLSEATTTQAPLPPGCNGHPIVITSHQGYLTSPDFNKSESYRPQLDCEWILLGTPDNVFYFTFHNFELEQSGACLYDSLSIYDTFPNNNISLNTSSEVLNMSSQINPSPVPEVNESGFALTEIARLCGLMLPYDVESSNRRVVLRFQTDPQVGGIGFNLSFTLRPPTVKCQQEDFQCGTSECIKYSLVCDGVSDCTDASDEIICATSKSCGRPSVQPVFSRIVGGSEAVEGSWPWTVSIVHSIPVPNIHACGATLILPQWVLTATHCFERIYSRKYDGFFIIAGRHQLNHPDKNEQIQAFGQVFLRHDYESRTSLNDIALIKVKEPFKMTDNVNLACLPQASARVGHLCYITGWGETLNTCCAGRMKQAAVPIMNSTTCSSPDYYGNRFMEHMMCAGYSEGGVDSCEGDSGGPLVCESQSPDRHWEVQGVTSWGVLCASPKQPGVYTAVHDYIKWIQQTIAQNTP